jgi:hypothetical protein
MVGKKGCPNLKRGDSATKAKTIKNEMARACTETGKGLKVGFREGSMKPVCQTLEMIRPPQT